MYARLDLYIGAQRILDHYMIAGKNMRKRAKEFFSLQVPSETKEKNLNSA